MTPSERATIFCGALAILALILLKRRDTTIVVPMLVPQALGYNAPPALIDPLAKPVRQKVGGDQ